MIATGPKPPLSFNSSNDEAPIKLDIGGGMGELRSVERRPKQSFDAHSSVTDQDIFLVSSSRTLGDLGGELGSCWSDALGHAPDIYDRPVLRRRRHVYEHQPRDPQSHS